MLLEVADADRLAAGGEQAVEDLDPVAVGERLEHALELVGLVVAQAAALRAGRSTGSRGAATIMPTSYRKNLIRATKFRYGPVVASKFFDPCRGALT